MKKSISVFISIVLFLFALNIPFTVLAEQIQPSLTVSVGSTSVVFSWSKPDIGTECWLACARIDEDEEPSLMIHSIDEASSFGDSFVVRDLSDGNYMSFLCQIDVNGKTEPAYTDFTYFSVGEADEMEPINEEELKATFLNWFSNTAVSLLGDAAQALAISWDFNPKENALEIIDGFTAGTLSYDKALFDLSEIGDSGEVSDEEMTAYYAALNSMRVSLAALDTAMKALDSEDYGKAILELRKIDNANSNYAEARTMLFDAITLYKDRLMARIDEYGDDLEKALADLEEAMKVLPNDVDVSIIYDELFKETGGNVAISDAKVNGDEPLEKVKGEPVYLDTIDYLSFTREYAERIVWDANKDKDNAGNFYNHAIGVNMSNVNVVAWGKIDYFINKGYSEFNGIYFLHQNSKNITNVTTLKIYADNKLLYTSPKFTAGSLPVEINLDVLDVTVLSFHFEKSAMSNGSTYIGVANPALYK